jgi:hypothetical protein
MNLKTLEFLQAVLPGEGSYVAYIVAGAKKYNVFASSIAELAERVLTEDAKGHAVYHACASFKIAKNNSKDTPRAARSLGRTQQNVYGAKAFWLDVDAGEHKPYPDAAAAARAVLMFSRSVAIPPPLLVGSGGGVHAYWPLDKMQGTETWKNYAEGLKALCHHHGLQADGVRTCDLASVLRTPGTHNRKHGNEKLVECGPIVGPYPLAAFEIFNETRPSCDQRRVTKAFSAEKSSSLVASAINLGYDTSPRYAHPIMEGCAQLRAVAAAPGHASEPEWYAALGVLAFCEDGLEAAKSWASPQWHHIIEEKIERQKEFGPSTCAKFQDINPARCADCPFAGKITSPIQLGKTATHDNGQISGGAVLQQQNPAAGELLTPEQPSGKSEKPEIELPENFSWKGKSLTFRQETLQGETIYTLISKNRLYLKGVQTGEIQNDSFSLLFMLELPHEGEKQIAISAKEFFSSAGISELSGKGAVIHEADLFRIYVRNAIDMWHDQNRLDKRYDQFGWKEDETAFVYGTHLYTPTRVLPILGSQEIKQRAQWLRPRAGGSLERWSAAANSLFAAGCEPQSFALLASFAAPLMRFHSTEEGGAIVSLLSRGSGSGKSTSLAAAASVWGLAKGLSLTNIDTKVSKGLTLGVLGNLPVVYDELTNRDPGIIREFVMMFTNGRDKMRGTQEGEIRHTQSSWQTLLISASNMSLVDILSTRGIDAPAFRVLEFNARLPEGLHKKGDALKKELEANYGFAGDVYLKYLLQPEVLAYVKTALPQWTEAIWAKTQLQSQHRFWVRTLGSIAVAGAIVKKMGILSFSPDRILEWALEQVTARRDETTITNTDFSAVNTLSEFLNEHVASMLVMPGPYTPKQRPQPLLKNIHKLLIRFEASNGRILISETAFREWLQKQEISAREVLNELKAKLIVTRPRLFATLGAGMELAVGQTACIEINGTHPALTGVLAPVHDVINEGLQKAPKGEAEVVRLRNASAPKA